MVEIYTELQDIFQNKLLGQKQIFDLGEQIKSFQPKEVSNLRTVVSRRKTADEKSISSKKSSIKPKGNVSKHSSNW